jgi:hypothetical protein
MSILRAGVDGRPLAVAGEADLRPHLAAAAQRAFDDGAVQVSFGVAR